MGKERSVLSPVLSAVGKERFHSRASVSSLLLPLTSLGASRGFSPSLLLRVCTNHLDAHVKRKPVVST